MSHSSRYELYLRMMQGEEGVNLQQQQTPEPVFESARSGRAKCRSCQTNIENATTRLGQYYMYDGNPSPCWYHINCIRVVPSAPSQKCTFCHLNTDTRIFYMHDASGKIGAKYFCFGCFGSHSRRVLKPDERISLENKITMSGISSALNAIYLGKLHGMPAGMGSSSSSSASSSSSSSNKVDDDEDDDDVEIISHTKGADAVAGSAFLGHDLAQADEIFKKAEAAGNIISLSSDEDEEDENKADDEEDDEVMEIKHVPSKTKKPVVKKIKKKTKASPPTSSLSSTSSSSTSSSSTSSAYSFSSSSLPSPSRTSSSSSSSSTSYSNPIIQITVHKATNSSSFGVGAELISLPEGTSSQLQIQNYSRLIITEVTSDTSISTAQASGLKYADVVISINGIRPRDLEHFGAIASGKPLIKLLVQRLKPNRSVFSRTKLKKTNTVTKLKQMLKKFDPNCNTTGKKDFLVDQVWIKQMQCEIAKDHLISVLIRNKDRNGTALNDLRSQCGDDAWSSVYRNALNLGTADNTFLTCAGGRYKLNLG